MTNKLIFNASMKRITIIRNDAQESIYFGFSEFHVVECLIENMVEIVDKNTLLSVGWPDRVVQADSLPVLIFHLRKKIEKLGFEIKCFKGRGYALFPLNEDLKIIRRNMKTSEFVLNV